MSQDTRGSGGGNPAGGGASGASGAAGAPGGTSGAPPASPGGTFRGPIDPNEAGGAPGSAYGDWYRVRTASWSWGHPPGTRSRVPWVGIFLVVLGGLLLVEEVVPGARLAGSAFATAIGIALLISWAINRQIWQLYAGVLVTALALPSALSDANVIDGGSGWGTLFLGVGLLGVAVIRWFGHSGIGWQFIVGALLALSGGSQVAERDIPNVPSFENLAWPIVILAVGVWLLLRSRARNRGF